jgi:hypothetical protein
LVTADAAGERPLGFAIGRLEAVADLSGALWLPSERALVVADLHFEKGSSYAARGVFLPPYDTPATLARLGALVARHQPRRIIALGDSFHDRKAAARLDGAAIAALAALQAGREMVWITGNHDPEPPQGLAGEVVDTLTIQGVTLRHEPTPSSAKTGPSGHEIAGHLHPVAKIRMRGRAIRRRCFVLDAERLILPALGAYAGGLNVRDAAFTALFPDGFEALMIGDERLYRLGRAALIGD